MNWSSLFKSQQAAAAAAAAADAAASQQSSTSKLKVPATATPGKPNATNSVASSLPVNSHAQTNGHSSDHTDHSKSADALKSLGNLFKDCQLKHSAPALQPRGLRNKQNWCYVNATLQALLACPPFYNLIRTTYLKVKSSNNASMAAQVPFLTALGRFVSEFKVMVRSAGDKSKELVLGEPFDIDYFYDALQQASSAASSNGEATFGKMGRQEDAQEFLSFLLNRLHDEMTKCLDALNPTTANQVNNNHSGNNYGHMNGNSKTTAIQELANADDNDDDWNVVGKKNRAYVTRKAEFKQSPLSDIFCGQFRSALSQPGVKDKESVSLEPFFTLPL
jgi:ubiquitin carboxyl-terminal hydrolase 10